MSNPAKLKLLILGGNRLNLFAIEEAKKNNFWTIVADKNPNASALSIADLPLVADIINPQDILQALGKIKIDAIVSMAEAGIQTAAAISEKLGLPGISKAISRKVTSKVEMRTHWAAIPQYSVNFRVVKTLCEAINAVCELGRYPVIFKPDKTFGGSRGVSLARNEHEIEKAFTFAKINGMNEKVLLEECVSGREFSSEVLVYKGETSVLCTGQKIKSPLPYRVDYSVQYQAHLTNDEALEINNMCHLAIQTLGIENGVSHIEFALTADGPKLFELGARCGGGHTPIIAKHVSGVNEFVEYCNISAGLSPYMFKPGKKKGADYRFLIFPPGKILSYNIPEEVINHPEILDVAITLEKDDVINELKTTGDRAGFVVTCCETIEQASELADWACKQITVKYANGRICSALKFEL